MTRTVLFSDESVANALSRCVSVWTNKTPDVAFPPGTAAGLERLKELPEGAGVTNVTAVFAAPDGLVLNAIPGYLPKEAFLEELRFATALERELFRDGKRVTDAAERLKLAHVEAAKKLPSSRFRGAAHQQLATEGAIELRDFGLRRFKFRERMR